MFIGILFALAAGMMWGLIFVGPVLVADYPAALQSTARYLAFGLVALPLAWFDRRRLRRLTNADWLEALQLTVIGNLLYYFCLASAIQRTGAPVSTMIIGTLPVVISVAANLFYGHEEGQLSWRRLTPPLLVIALGLALVNIAELKANVAPVDPWRYGGGLVLAVIAVACWTWFPLRNARWLRKNPATRPSSWATAQGVVTFPLALLGYIAVCGQLSVTDTVFALPFGPRPDVFIPLMLAIGVLCSWIGALCWNEASQRLPTVLLGPLIVFEILAGLAYTFLLRQAWPPLLTLAGIACLVAGVIGAMRVKPAALEART
ncbi:DMT family transporter [Erwinia amylovora]|uniref:Inner membrane protein ytfF n=3 Tax=Erwinia amylovora TaxID=552 RepID=A0A830ZX22_ERWAM|nr:DMT family transporter [Erwinia amylovora]CDK14247.1 Inner membrane protein ytfF [Erwinia amylovora LA635]CDK17614.1 Inner membrane protein ytfF [Erwinia amylovora LA636]CDK20983.1 Inner membrane protein ytfF [Erwinia amylovora LA637]ATZ12542.1 EamA/RhaT family transporter [Erwinia amylovora]EKV55506.1 Inner membrane protein ytfF [Erwinia amylovora ACW56400]